MMDSLSYVVGWVAITGGLALLATVAAFIIGNIYGGIKGSYRLVRYMPDYSPSVWWKPHNHWVVIRRGLRAWAGERYRNGLGSYYDVRGRIIPVDGRDPLPEPPEAA